MKNKQNMLPQDFYLEYLSSINDIHFTKREIDVMACLLNARRTSKTASFLSIDPRTVETHVRNIMSKIECNSRERIIDFIEFSEKLPRMRQYYSLLRINTIFEKILRDISFLQLEKVLIWALNYPKNKDSVFHHFISHLKLAGIKVSTSAREKKASYGICFLPKFLAEEELYPFFQKIPQNISKVLCLLPLGANYTNIPKNLVNSKNIDLVKQASYYFSFYAILKQILPNFNLDKFISEFEEQEKKIFPEDKLPQISLSDKKLERLFVYPIKAYFLAAFFVIGLISSVLLAFQWDKKGHKHLHSQPDLIIPKESVFLNRPELINQIDNKLKGQSGIQSVALVGMGGSGKTTLARQYARMHIADIVWEINAETRENLNTSFEKLAQVLAKRELDQITLARIKEIKDPLEKEERIILFVKEHLKSQSNWILIYDNVEVFTDIQKHFPYESHTWGQGKIILTTRDNNIENNKHINYVLIMPELDDQQRFNLFKKIMSNTDGYPSTLNQTKEINQFLKKIPPFPLDISIAAYYLKATKMSYVSYIENLEQSNKDFTSLQENILNEIGDYTKSRNGIIIVALQEIIKKHEDFAELLLTISLLDSQNIPRDLLSNFKNSLQVSSFVYNLKKYSLIINEQENSSSPNLSVSIHRSIQAISLSYLTKILRLEKNKELIKCISEKLVNYGIDKIIKEIDVPKMQVLAGHLEKLLNHKHLLTSEVEGEVKGVLGVINYFFGDNKKAKNLFEASLLQLNKLHNEKPTLTALFIGYLGNVYRDLGDYIKGKKLLEQSISIYKKYYPQSALNHAFFLVYLGIIERILGNYEVAKDLFQEGLSLHKKHFSDNDNYAAWVHGQLAIIDREIGDYEKAKVIMERSLDAFKKECSDIHFDIAWALEHLGDIYIKLDDSKKAKDALEESLRIYASYFPDELGQDWVFTYLQPLSSSEDEKNYQLFAQITKKYKTHFHENYIYACYPLMLLGQAHIKLGNYKKAKVILEQVLTIYQINYGNTNIATAYALNALGEVYFIENNIKVSERFFNEACRIFRQNNHPDSYKCLENLSELYLKKSVVAQNEGNIKLEKDFKNQLINYLKQALEILQSRFPNNSPHTVRIKSKLSVEQTPPTLSH
ncbi:tetratricopeptide repeat protein [Candidatus Paracaedibacter symbiosus]|uniref:tetratricopeptide repeat protein n=1 Tax=Candidatus Paracaedibacter symbiosus TaxID=244582 RepID=UPI000509E075|nr:tetratricopeptide repeat protein [Candidatus Paracaedibacter symbiosus]